MTIEWGYIQEQTLRQLFEQDIAKRLCVNGPKCQRNV